MMIQRETVVGPWAVQTSGPGTALLERVEDGRLLRLPGASLPAEAERGRVMTVLALVDRR